MNINTIKSLAWVGALAVGGVLGWRVYDFLGRRAELERGVSQEEQRAVLDDEFIKEPEKPKADVVAYPIVQQVFHTMNWTGRKPPEPKPIDETKPVKPALKRVADLLKVLMIQVDTDEPEASFAFVAYTDGQLLALGNRNPDLRVLHQGDALPAPYGYARVLAIGEAGVRFSIEEEGQEHEPEFVPPVEGEIGTRIVKVDEDGEVLRPNVAGPIPSVPDDYPAYNPKSTTQTGRNEFRIGTEDASVWNTDYTKILSRDVRYARYRNPRTGEVEGIQIKEVVPGSLPDTHGVSAGEIVKSINGHKVTSVNEAIAFVKKEADHTTVWIVEIEKGGRTYFRTYHSPNE